MKDAKDILKRIKNNPTCSYCNITPKSGEDTSEWLGVFNDTKELIFCSVCANKFDEIKEIIFQ